MKEDMPAPMGWRNESRQNNEFSPYKPLDTNASNGYTQSHFAQYVDRSLLSILLQQFRERQKSANTLCVYTTSRIPHVVLSSFCLDRVVNS